MNLDTEEQLTTKQRENRRYYARHSEEIKAKKRESYKKTASGKKTSPMQARKEKGAKARRTEEINIKNKNLSDHPEKLKKSEIRRRIEDILLARELGLDDVI